MLTRRIMSRSLSVRVEAVGRKRVLLTGGNTGIGYETGNHTGEGGNPHSSAALRVTTPYLDFFPTFCPTVPVKEAMHALLMHVLRTAPRSIGLD